MWFFMFGFCIHIVLLLSIFDIYFKSPIVKNVTPYQPVHDPLADRLVLIVVDGLRAETFVNYTAMPKLRARAERGMWGVSHTRVPTESRPGHVAMIAGFYEDPSAITKGWKSNPVDFDSVLNRTVYSWGWGAYDVIGIFGKGLVDDHVYLDKYDEYINEAFSTDKNATIQDSIIFSKVREFFEVAKTDPELNEKLNNRQIMFFLHLIGTDSAGHTHRPNTEIYFNSLKYVDDGIEEMENLIRNFYNDDGRTTFLATSDHGMSDWGSHGAGSSHETETPLVVWGSGVRQISVRSKSDDIIVGLPHELRHDINQADITPLMSTILSIPIPVNSIGRLHVDFLDMSQPEKAKAIYANCRQLASQYNTKRLSFEAHIIPLLYKPYKEFDERKYNEIIEYTEKLLAQEKYDELILLSEEIMNLSTSGLDYYHNYYQTVLLVLVTLIFIGWIVYLINYLILNIRTQSSNINVEKNVPIWKNKILFMWIHVVLAFITFIPISLVYVQNLPYLYYVYFTLPVILTWLCVPYSDVWVGVITRSKTSSNVGSVLIQTVCYTLGSLAMGLCFTHRWMLSIPLVGMAIWPYLSTCRSHIPRRLLYTWPVCCVLLTTFSVLPVVGKQVHIELVVLAGLLKLTLIFELISSRKTILKVKRPELILMSSQLFILVLALVNIFVQSRRFTLGTPVNFWWQAEAWVIAVTSFLFPVFYSTRVLCRLAAINLSVFTFYLLLSVAHEGLFLITLTVTLSVWLMIEYAIVYGGTSKIQTISFDGESRSREEEQKSMLLASDRLVNQQDFRRAFFFLVYIIVAFFGTGNIASLNSFEVRWVTCFITSYKPFIITGLILLKTLAPFLCVACTFRAIQQFTKAPLGLLNIIVLIYSNIMGVQLLFYVKNTGSWLEIGTSISQYVIVQVITLFIVVIDQLAKVITEVSCTRAFNRLVTSGKKYM